jgi:glucokinase
LINDFVAAGYGVLTLNIDTECVTLQKALKQTTAPIACVGAGMDLGQCYLISTFFYLHYYQRYDPICCLKLFLDYY